jgi:uncharacterized protein YgiM (DUF1202 family)
MHFELDVSPEELASGIDWSTVKGDAFAASPAEASVSKAYRVIARQGLRLRSGPGTEFQIITTVAFNTVVQVLSQDGSWWIVDLQGDGAADGHMHGSYLTPA